MHIYNYIESNNSPWKETKACVQELLTVIFRSNIRNKKVSEMYLYKFRESLIPSVKQKYICISFSHIVNILKDLRFPPFTFSIVFLLKERQL